MMRWVVDASVIVKRFIPEVDSEYAVRLFDDINNEFLAPDLAVCEVGNIIWKKVRRGELAVDEGHDVLHAFESTSIEMLNSSPYVSATYQLAIALDRTFYDSLYLAIAVQLDCKMITADERLVNSLGSTPVGKNIRLLRHI